MQQAESFEYDYLGVTLSKSPKWEEQNFGFAPNGIDNCITRAMKKEKPTMAQIIMCKFLLKARIRWPIPLQESIKPFVAKNRIHFWWSSLWWRISRAIFKRKIPYIHKILFRSGEWPIRKFWPWHRMSRDPFTHYYKACWERGLPSSYIKEVRLPWHIATLKLLVWKWYLAHEKPWMLHTYEWLELHKLNRPMRRYVLNMVKSRGVISIKVRTKILSYDKMKLNKGEES